MSALALLALFVPLHAQPGSTGSASENRQLETFDAAWRIVHETYFDPTFGGVDWEAVRAKLRPRAAEARDIHQLRTVIEEMLSRLGGSHMALIPGDVASSLQGHSVNEEPSDDSIQSPASGGSNSDPEEERDGEIGLEVRIKDDRALVTRVASSGPAAKAGIKPGWIIESVDGEPVHKLLQQLPERLDPLRAQFVAWGVVNNKLLGPLGSSVSLNLLDGRDRHVKISVDRRQRQGDPATIGYLPTFYARLETDTLSLADSGNVGVIRFNLWMVPIVRALDNAIDRFRQADGIVLDLRGNLGGLGAMILGVSGHFLDQRVSLGTLKMRGNELKFFANPRRVNAAGERVQPYSGPVAILIDGITLSAAEIFAGGMQDIGRARIFGERSGGQALPAIWDRLPNGDVLYHAFGDFITPLGRRLEGKGVAPDEPIPSTRADLLNGRDAPLGAALQWIAQQRSAGKP